MTGTNTACGDIQLRRNDTKRDRQSVRLENPEVINLVKLVKSNYQLTLLK